MQALILAGGKGTRLLPYTAVLPKPLMPIGEIPILEIILRQLKNSGFTSVVLAVNYLSHMFELFFQEGERLGIKIEYSFEDEPLGTAGPIANAIDLLEDNFLVMNGDLLTTLNYKDLYDFHVKSNVSATIAVHQRTVDIDYGVVNFDKDNKLIGYDEKPKLNYDVSMGINVLNKSSIESLVKKDSYLDIPDLMMQISQQEDSEVLVYKADCEWLDMGRIDDYSIATELFEKNRALYLGNE